MFFYSATILKVLTFISGLAFLSIAFNQTVFAQTPRNISTWVGSYICQEGQRNVTIQFSLNNRGRGEATLFFTPNLSSSVSTGFIKMFARYNKSRGTLSFDLKKRIRRVNGRGISGFSGAFSPKQVRFNGKVRSSGCRTINLVKKQQSDRFGTNRAVFFPPTTRLEDLTAFRHIYWRGTIVEKRKTHDIVVKFDKKGAQVLYEPNRCKGEWRLVDEGQNNFQFEETIRETNRNCQKSGRVHITKETNGRLGFHWRESADSQQFKVSTFLDAVQGNYPPFSKNKRSNGALELWSRAGIIVSLARSSRKCTSYRTLEIDTEDFTPYEEPFHQLSQFLSASLTNLGLSCTGTIRYDIIGKTKGVIVFNGALSLNGNWQLSRKPSPLDIETRKLRNNIKNFSDVEKIGKILSRYSKIPRFDRTQQYRSFTSAARKIVLNLIARNNGLHFDQYMDQTYAELKSAFQMKLKAKKAISAVSAVLPSEQLKLEQKLKSKLAKISREEWNTLFLSELSGNKPVGKVLVVVKDKAVRLKPEWVQSIELDEKLNEWLSERINSHPTESDEDYKRVVSRKKILLNEISQVSLPDVFSKSKAFLEASASTLQDEITRIDTIGFVNSELTDGDIFEDTIAKIASKTQGVTLDQETGEELDLQVHNWMKEEIELYKSLTDDSYLNDVSERVKLADALGKVKLPAVFSRTNAVTKTELEDLKLTNKNQLAELTKTATDIISATGETYEDIDLIFDEGLALATQFENAGFLNQANEILDASGKRIDELINAGHESLKVELASVTMSREVIAAYQQQSNALDELSDKFEGFKDYIITIEQGIAAGRQRECFRHVNDAFGGNPNVQFVAGTKVLTARELACSLYQNDHVLTNYKHSRLWSSPVMKISLANGDLEEIELEKSSDTDAYVGVSKTVNGDTTEFTPENWARYISDLTIPPPTGKPNAHGVTECDLLTADPNDPNKLAKGIDFGQQDAGYDFDRAIDACIAAIEYSPQEPRHYYQLARVLNFLGMEEEASSYAEISREARYAPAYFLSAELKMTDEDEEAFFDAIDYLKEGARLGYAPAKTLLAELVPPGTNFFRPLPAPSDEHIINTVGRRKCTPTVFGIQSCVIRTDVHSKDCFQTGAKTFSCEVRFRIACKVTSENEFMNQGPQIGIFRGLMEGGCAANPITDPSFETIRVN